MGKMLKESANLESESPLILFNHLHQVVLPKLRENNQWFGFNFCLVACLCSVMLVLKRNPTYQLQLLVLLSLLCVPLSPAGSYLINTPYEALRNSLRTLKLNSACDICRVPILCSSLWFYPIMEFLGCWANGSRTWLLLSPFCHVERVPTFT